jgi:hypothetical protein
VDPARALRPVRLVASRPLGVLDEARVPYERVPEARRDDSWARLSADVSDRALHWWSAERGGTAARYSVGSTPVWGRVVPEPVVARFAATLEGQWRPDVPVLDAAGVPYSSIWRSTTGGTIVPFDPDQVRATFRTEGYRDFGGSASRSLERSLRRAYYLLRPLVRRRLQIAARRAFSRLQARVDFPRWPVETALHDLDSLILGYVADTAAEPVPYLAAWPSGYSWAFVLTHDVETARGRDAIERVRAVEESAGLRSSWNLVPERYVVPDELVARLHAAGCEVGVHGLRHDGRDLASFHTLRRRVPEVRRWARRWDAVGFRAPATQRVWDWMPMLGFDYDSSYPDTDVYEPISGGCCSWLPFFNRDLVELPITLPQDHTLFVILRRDERLWHEKTDVLRRRGGMALLIVHPDYMLEDRPLRAYDRFLSAYGSDATAWRALPREVSAWWRRRAATSLEFVAGAWRASGPAAAEAAIAFISPRHPSGQVRPSR